MKHSNHTVLLRFLLLLSVIGLTACSDQDQAVPTQSLAEAMDDTPMEHAAKHLDPKYVCPMNPPIARYVAWTWSRK